MITQKYAIFVVEDLAHIMRIHMVIDMEVGRSIEDQLVQHAKDRCINYATLYAIPVAASVRVEGGNHLP